MEAKAKEEAKRQRVVEDEEKKNRTMEYLQRLRDEILEEEAALLEGAEGSQVAGSKCKEVTAGDEEGVMKHFGHELFLFFLLFSDFIRILFFFLFLFFWTMKRHVTLQSHEMSHDVMS